MESMMRAVGPLVKSFVDGEMQVPEIQRRYVWSGEQVRALIDSLYKGYPSGSILLWETHLPPKARPAHAEGRGGAPCAALGPSMLLLDGQQRLASLAAVMTGMPVRTAGGRGEARPVEVYFNVDHPERPSAPDTAEEEDPWRRRYGGDRPAGGADHATFQVRNRRVEGSETWIPATRLFMEGPTSVLVEMKIAHTDPRYSACLRRLNRLYNVRDTYMYPVQVLGRDMPYEEVADVFVRLNSHGARMRRADLALARVTASWQGAMDTLGDTAEWCEERGYALDEAFMLKCLVSVMTGRCELGNVGRISVDDLRKGWIDGSAGLRRAVGFLSQVAGIDTSSALPSVRLLIPIASVAARAGRPLSRETERGALGWLYAAMLGGRYTDRSADAALDADLGAARRAGGDPFDAMAEGMAPRAGGAEIGEGGTAGGGAAQGALACTMYSLARRAGAVDWRTGLPVGAGEGRDVMSERGRIFARPLIEPMLAKRHGRKKALLLSGDAANYAFGTGRRPEGAEGSPAEYLPEVVGRLGAGALASQCVPRDPALWRADRYEDFLAARRAEVARAAGDAIGGLGGGKAAACARLPPPPQPPQGKR